MQCVILAAGKGTRLRPLTETRPKSLVLVSGKPILRHILERLPDQIVDVFIVVGYRGDQIVAEIGDEAFGRHIHYVWQEEQLGTAHALGLCKGHLNGKFLLLNADDIYDKRSLEDLVSLPLGLLAEKHEHPERFGVLTLNEDGTLCDIIEKPKEPPTNLVATGAMVLDPDIFKYKAEPHANGEYFIPVLLTQLAKDRPVFVRSATMWVTVNMLEDVTNAEAALQKENISAME